MVAMDPEGKASARAAAFCLFLTGSYGAETVCGLVI